MSEFEHVIGVFVIEVINANKTSCFLLFAFLNISVKMGVKNYIIKIANRN